MNKNALEDEPTKKRKEHEEKEEEDDDENDFEKKRRYQIAMQRWAILKQALLGGKSSETCKSRVSVRRFSSFGLLQTEYLFSNNKEETWYQYTCADFPNFKMTIKHLAGKINANSLNGFNNTGNVFNLQFPMNKNALEDEPTKKRKEHEEKEEEDDDENDFEKKRRYQIAMQRWAILKQALLGGKSSETCKSSVSVRRFSSFGLLQTEYLFSNNKEETWYQYTCADFPNFKMTIKHLAGKINANSLNGFNNTGNVCVWPSEEVMAYYCMKHLDEFRNKNIIELGGGMTCLAGVAVSILSEAQSVVLTDGNEESIDNLTDILNDKSNAELLRETKVSSRMLRWGEGELDKDLGGHFDIIICADCLFFDEGREDLVQLVYDLLKPNGKCWMFAPKRGATFDEFKQVAEEKFYILEEERFEKKVYDLHCKLKESGTDQYDPNIHFPIHLQLTKKDVS